MVSRVLVRASRSDRLARLAANTPLVQRVAGRFIAGTTLEDGIAAAMALEQRGRLVSLDLVGEHVRTATEARDAADDQLRTLEAIGSSGLTAGISVKPSQLGAGVDLPLATDLLERIARSASAIGVHVTLDMESSDTTDATITLVERLHGEGHAHVGCAVQAYLHRTPDDIDRLNELGASVRLCKGAYAEPATAAHQRRADVDAAYAACATRLLEHGSYPRFATHDHRLIGHVRREAHRLGTPRDGYEFQLLYGVRPDVQERLVTIGERVCVYVPFGVAWYPYFVRRLAERPANLVFLLRALLPTRRRRGAGR